MPSDEFAVAGLMAVELKAGRPSDQTLQSALRSTSGEAAVSRP